LIRSVRALHPYRPLYYSLGDETGIGDLSAFWDFDFSDFSLAAMREWLKSEYHSLAALNRQWGTAFQGWDEVVPMTTAEAMKSPTKIIRHGRTSRSGWTSPSRAPSRAAAMRSTPPIPAPCRRS
jgi:hypothetical protein